MFFLMKLEVKSLNISILDVKMRYCRNEIFSIQNFKFSLIYFTVNRYQLKIYF